MAEIVLGLGTSHSPLLSVPWHLWAQYAERDRRNPWLFGTDGRKRSYPELLETAAPAVAQELTPEKFRQRDDLNQRGIAQVAAALAKATPDILVMVGDDQEEVFTPECMPALCVFWGDTVPYRARQPRDDDIPMKALVERYGGPEVWITGCSERCRAAIRRPWHPCHWSA